MSDWRRQQLKRSDDPVDQQRYRVELCRAGEHCGCQDEVGVTPTFEVYQERRFRRERDGFDVLQITLEVSGRSGPPKPGEYPTERAEIDARLDQCEVSLAGEWLRTRPWLVRNERAERDREQVFQARGRQGGLVAAEIARTALRSVREQHGEGVTLEQIMHALDTVRRFSERRPPPHRRGSPSLEDARGFVRRLNEQIASRRGHRIFGHTEIDRELEQAQDFLGDDWTLVATTRSGLRDPVFELRGPRGQL